MQDEKELRERITETGTRRVAAGDKDKVEPCSRARSATLPPEVMQLICAPFSSAASMACRVSSVLPEYDDTITSVSGPVKAGRK